MLKTLNWCLSRFTCAASLVLILSLFGSGNVNSQAQYGGVRSSISVSLRDAQNLSRAGKHKDALRKIEEAESALDRSEAEYYVVQRVKASISLAAGDNPAAIRAFESAITSPAVSAVDRLRMVVAIAGLHYRSKDYFKSAYWARRYWKEGGNDPAMHTLTIQSYVLSKDCASAMSFLEATENSGRAVVEEELMSVANCFRQFSNDLGYLGALEKLDSRFPKEVYAQEIQSIRKRISQAQSVPAPSSQVPSEGSKSPAREKSFGTGVLVNSNGYIATNHHVVEQCSSIFASVAGQGRLAAQLIASDTKSDTAVIKVSLENLPHATIRSVPARAGESVITIGFPLKGLLASEPNVATGTVSATAGIRNDTTRLQVSAPVQPGNSGGPLIDESELLVGLVVSKLNVVAVYKATGDLPQNVNFAVKAEVVRFLLDANSVTYKLATREPKRLSVPDMVEQVKRYTVLIECD